MPNLVNLFAFWDLELNLDNLSRYFPASLKCGSFKHPGDLNFSRRVSLEEFLAKGEDIALCPLEDCSEFESWAVQDILDIAYMIGDPQDINMRILNFQTSIDADFSSIFKPHPEGKTFTQIRQDKITLEILENPELAKDVLAKFACVDNFDPVSDEQDFLFISKDLDQRPGAPLKLIQVLYGNYDSHFYRIPKKLMKAKTFEEIHKDDRYSYWPEPPGCKDEDTFLTFANYPVKFALEVKETDDASVMEAFSVFAREMPLDDALNAARVI